MGIIGRYLGANLLRHKRYVLGRTACLGNDLFSLRYSRKLGYRLINQQKVRLDLWLEWVAGKKERPKAEKVYAHMARIDVLPLIHNQSELPWLGTKDFEFMLMDSFAELTDQKFRHRQDGWEFTCHYSDLNHSSELEKDFECLGLLPLEEIEPTYIRFFDWFEKTHPNKQVVFAHFPTSLDERELYKVRGQEIFRTMSKLGSKRGFIFNLSVADKYVDWHEEDRFPYHFAKSTYQAFLNEWQKVRCDANS